MSETKLSDSAYFVDAVELTWGLTLKQARELITEDKLLRSYGGQSNFRARCKDAFGFRVTEVNVRAPREDAPVLQVSYELSAPDDDASTVDPGFWVNTISQLLGEPEKNPDPLSYPLDPSSSGSVIYNTHWLAGNVRVTLSTYGGYRENEEGAISIASLFIDWENEILFAEPYLEAVEQIEQSLVVANAASYARDIVAIGSRQTPYYLANYYLENPHAAAEDNALRRAQRVLRKPQLFDTPARLASLLTENSALIWQPEGQRNFVFSTRWDSVYCYPDPAENTISWVNMLPAKGAGGMSLSVNGLSVSGPHSCEAISELAGRISAIQNNTIKCMEGYDC